MAATTATAMQSFLLASTATGASSRNRMIQFYPVNSMPRLQRNVGFRVRCSGKEEQPPSSSTEPKKSTKFSDLFAFDGPAPERINGRLAMVGFVAALAVELSKGEDVFTQISDGGISLFLATSIVFTIASLIPLFRGVSVESKSGGFMTSDAEIWNGRFAMLGLIALAFTEFVKGGTLV